ncbi:MAG TPA: pitrilysin family protein [Blastocatellia bacterium]|nr:pitrilysin family protein [Blastocatellia bacterium]
MAVSRKAAAVRLNVERVALPNGLVVLVSENHSTPSISISAMVRAGSRFEDDENAGLASLAAELIEEGTTTRTSKQIAEAVDSTGGHLMTFGDHQSSRLAVVALSRDFELVLDIASDVLMNAVFPEDKVRQQTERRAAQIVSRLDVPRTQASDIFNEIVFRGTPQHRPAVGYEATVRRLSRKGIEEFYRRYYVPNNAALAIAGDIDGNEAIECVASAFSTWERARDFVPPDVPRPSLDAQPVERYVSASKEQVNVFIGHLGIERKDPDYHALLVMDTILGSSPGFTSRIPRILRDEQGLAYSTFANITSSAGIDPGRFVAYIGTAPTNLDRARAGLRGEIARIVEEGVTEEELEIAKSYLTGSFVLRFQRNGQVAEFMLEAETYGLGFDYLEKYPELIRAVTVEDVNRVTRKHIHPERLTTVVVGPVDEAGRVINKELNESSSTL